MEKLLTAPLSSKGQVTLPKTIREALGVTKEGDLVHFMIRGSQVILTRGFFIAPAEVEFSAEELERLRAKSRKSGRKVFQTPQAAIHFVDKL